MYEHDTQKLADSTLGSTEGGMAGTINDEAAKNKASGGSTKAKSHSKSGKPARTVKRPVKKNKK